MENVSVTVFRYDPTTDDAPRYQTYEVPYEKGMRVLGVLLYIQENLDTSLAFRYSCRRRRCGSCGVVVNGKPGLACMEEAKQNMVLDPLPNLPVIRDLVVQIGEYEERIQGISPYLVRMEKPKQQPEKILPINVASVRPLNQCIECFLCMRACPFNDINWEGFAGPAILVQLARRLFDPRDDMDRMPDVARVGAVNCATCYSCDNTCPVGIRIVEDAIQNIKKEYVENERSRYSKYSKAWKDTIVKNGLVNRFIVMGKISSIIAFLSGLITNSKLFLKGKISLSSKRISNIEEMRTIKKISGEKR
jgi:fumarate reductase (CoM/CoB) subunit B